MKNVILKLCFILILAVSLSINLFQYRNIKIYKSNDVNINQEVIASILDLELCLDTLNEENYVEKTTEYSRISGKIYTLATFSTYKNNNDIRACFRNIDNLFIRHSKYLVIYKKEIETLLNKTIDNTDKAELSEKHCKELSDFIFNNITSK